MLDDSKILSHLAVSFGAGVSLVALASYLKSRGLPNQAKLPYPPGPRGLPLVGNILDLPRDMPIWKGFMQMAETYQTEVMYLNMFGTNIVVLNSSEAVADLMDKRSAIYSDKPRSPMLELMGLNKWGVVAFEYGERWRIHRRLFHQFFNVATVDRYDEDQRKMASRLLKNLSDDPADFHHHIKLATGSLALSVTYGIRVDSPKNPYFSTAEGVVEKLEEAQVPGAFPVEFLPFLRHFPSWFPGGGARSYGESVYKSSMECITSPMKYAVEQYKTGGETSGSFVAECLGILEESREWGANEEVIRNVAGLVYLATADPSNQVLDSFFLAMARNTRALKAAQKQLDDVLGGERLAEHSDMGQLPYITAIIKECLRWAPPLPLGSAHRLMEDNIYKGMLIPAGATVIENIWAICYDESVYTDPEAFNPERFLAKDGKIDPSVKDPEVRIFGSGRRICPGRHFALRNLHLVIANILAVFDILPPLDENGNPQSPPAAFKHSQVRHPLPFNCIIKPRSEKALELVRDLYSQHWS